MLKHRVVWVGISLALILSLPWAGGQDAPKNGWYQIVRGDYFACCGITSVPDVEPLPSDGIAYVELKADPTNNLAQMRFLAQDMHTILRLPRIGSRPDFLFAFTNGMIFSNHIQFEAPLPPPGSVQAYFDYTISNVNDTLHINGRVFAPCGGCADVHTDFRHTNVVAVLMPAANIRRSQVEVSWLATSNRIYQVQYCTCLNTNVWIDLGLPLVGVGSMTRVFDSVLEGQPQRFYRVWVLP